MLTFKYEREEEINMKEGWEEMTEGGKGRGEGEDRENRWEKGRKRRQRGGREGKGRRGRRVKVPLR